MKKRRNYNEVDYWDTLADAMLALFLCILLIVLLFILYFTQLHPGNDHIDDYEGDSWEQYTSEGDDHEHEEEHLYDDPYEGSEQDVIIVSGGGGGRGGGGETRGEGRTPIEVPRSEGGDSGEKSAVLVEVVDGETLLPIAREGIRFELYDEKNRLQILNDYYPTRVEHSNFETTKEGYFYLPEKIYEGYYSLHPQSVIEGYNPPEDTSFYLEQYYDWETPYQVAVRVFPLRRAVRVQLVDMDTGEGIAGASFQVIAAENIVTLDGTVRYRIGQVADTIITNATGYAESRELYLGTYLLRQEQVPEYYGIITEDTRTVLTEETAYSEENTETLRAEKTTMVLQVRDALYDDTPIGDAEFEVLGGIDQSGRLISDSAGQIVLTNLMKNTSYRIRQVKASSDYRIDPVEHSFTVDAKGLIQGLVRQEMIIENRMIRASFRVTGTLLGNRVSDVRMELMDSKGAIVRQWTTSGMDMLITGLEPDAYRLIIGGDDRNPVELYIADAADLQIFHYTRWTLADTGITAVSILVLLGAGLIAFVVIRRRKKRSGGTNIT